MLIAGAPDTLFFDSSNVSEFFEDGMGAVGGLICEPCRSGCTRRGRGTGTEGRDGYGAGAACLVLAAWPLVVLSYSAGRPESLRIVGSFVTGTDLFTSSMSSSEVESLSLSRPVVRCRTPLYGAGVNSHLPRAPCLYVGPGVHTSDAVSRQPEGACLAAPACVRALMPWPFRYALKTSS